MIEVRDDRLLFSFPDVAPHARLEVEFQRTLRVPADGRDYPPPPGFGRFPLRHVDDFRRTAPPRWLTQGGVLLPLYQSEALWIGLTRTDTGDLEAYPVAVKIAAGKINAVSGAPWRSGLARNPQDYVVTPGQRRLDGYCVQKGVIRQFAAVPLGSGETAEEQITGRAEFGGLQLMAIPMKPAAYRKRFPRESSRVSMCLRDRPPAYDMGLATGGRMGQAILRDPYPPDEWDLAHSSRCFVHLCNSEMWARVTGEYPPTKPVTASDYARAGLPWLEPYGEPAGPGSGSRPLARRKRPEQCGPKGGGLRHGT